METVFLPKTGRSYPSLREKMKLPSAASVTATTSSQSRLAHRGNRNVEKKTRKIEFGWLNYQDTVYKQVRRATGGGTREIIVKKDERVSSILERGKTLFFPGGKSVKGKLEDFDCMLSVTVSGEPLEGSVTLKNLIEQTHHKVLRVYLCTKAKEYSIPELSDEVSYIHLTHAMNLGHLHIHYHPHPAHHWSVLPKDLRIAEGLSLGAVPVVPPIRSSFSNIRPASHRHIN